MRYIEANPVRAGLIENAGQWRWSSFAVHQGRQVDFVVSDGPVELPEDWPKLVRQYLDDHQIAHITRSVKRGTPLGDRLWPQITATKLNLEPTLRARGRLRKQPPEKGTADP